MFTIIVVELQRRRAFTLHAVALGSDALAGYSGALPLFVPGKKSPTAEVLVEVGPTARGNEEKVDAKKQDDEVLIVHVAPNDEGTALEEKVDNERPDEEGVTVPVVVLEPRTPHARHPHPSQGHLKQGRPCQEANSCTCRRQALSLRFHGLAWAPACARSHGHWVPHAVHLEGSLFKGREYLPCRPSVGLPCGEPNRAGQGI